MTVTHLTNNPDNQANQDAEAKALADKILDNFELPESLANKINEAEKVRDNPVVEEEEATEEETPDVAAESQTEEVAESEQSEEESEEEELIPKSTFQRRLDEMTREKRLLEARLRKLEESNSNPQVKDEDLSKLEKMSESELVSLKKQVRLSQIKSASDDVTLGKLMELEDKIENVMRTAPQRFQSNQIAKFNEAVQASASEVQGFDKVQKDIFSLAKRIYDTAPELHASVNGQARAWNLAVEHFKLMQDVNIGKTKITELNREKNTMKKKISMPSVGKKASQESDSSEKLFKKAKYGETRDKVDFIRKVAGTDAIVDSFMANRG